jgi:hypothetical protein
MVSDRSFYFIEFCKVGINLTLQLCKIIPCQIIEFVEDGGNFGRF